jgi:hypothetical protein
MAQFSHKGVDIDVSEYGNFTCEIEGTKYDSDTLLALKDKIDRQLKAKVEIAKAAPLALPVTGLARSVGLGMSRQNYRAASGVITGINRTTGNLIIKADGIDKEWNWDVVMIDTPDNRALLTELAAVQNRTTELRRKAEASGLRYSRAHSSISHEHYGDRITELQQEYDRRATLQPA